MTTQDILTLLATVTEATIALFTIYGVCTMPRRKPCPGQLEIDFSAVPMEPASEVEVIEPDVWDEQIAPFSPLPTVAPLHTQPPYLLLLPPAKAETVKHTPKTLRNLCQQQGIKWRNAHGKNRHLSVAEMRQLLGEVRAIA